MKITWSGLVHDSKTCSGLVHYVFVTYTNCQQKTAQGENVVYIWSPLVNNLFMTYLRLEDNLFITFS